MEPLDAEYIKWLKERENAAEQFGVPVDNSRPNIINIAMVDLLRNNPSYFNVGKIKDYEAALWMSKNIPTLFYATHHRPLLSIILNDEIKFLDAVSDGTKKNDNKERPTVAKMKEMIEILKKPPRPVPVSKQTPVAAPVSKQTPAAALVSTQTPNFMRHKTKLAVIEEGDEGNEDDGGDNVVIVSEQIPTVAPASEPLGKEEAARTLNALVLEHVNDFVLRNEALDHIFNLSSESPEEKREIVEKLTKLMTEHVKEPVFNMRAMHCISILKGNEGGYRRIKHSKKKHSRKCRKSRKSRRYSKKYRRH